MQSANNTATEEEIKKISLWVAIASIMQISESLIPHPIPGIRFGLANMITLTILANYTFLIALEVAVLRTIVSSFIIGTFMSPAFVLSFSAALTSTLAMGILYRISYTNTKFYFSLIGISVLGAFIHNVTQLIMAYLLLIRHSGIFVLLPWLSVGAVVMGVIAGSIAVKISQRLTHPQKTRLYIDPHSDTEAPFESSHYIPGNSFIHRLRPEIKLLVVILFGLVILSVKNLWFYMFIVSSIIIMVFACRTSFLRMLLRITKIFPLILFSFFLPVFFNDGGEIAFWFGPFAIADDALSAGILFSTRIVVLLMIATLFVQTTSIEETTRGLRNILYPFRIFGIDPGKAGKIITLSWQWIPELYKEIRSMMKFLFRNKEKRLKNIMAALTDFILFLFQKEHP